MLLSGQEDNYKVSAFYLEKFLRIKADDSQIHRLCEYYGEHLEAEIKLVEGEIVESSKLLLSKVGGTEVIYVMLDGCLLPTRPHKSGSEEIGSWREMKLGRVFRQSAHLDLGKKPNIIRESLYVCHFGKQTDFINKFEKVVDEFEKLADRLVFVSDGAPWIGNWIQSCYPQATAILDFYHACEYLHDFSKAIYSKKEEEQQRNKWVSQQKLNLLNDKIGVVIDSIEQIESKGKKKKEAQQKIVRYYTNNQHRMHYKTYRDRGLLIGSGPIESAHRFVFQKRMKQSGQKWTKKGGQAIANIRVVHLNNQWYRVIELINKTVSKEKVKKSSNK